MKRTALFVAATLLLSACAAVPGFREPAPMGPLTSPTPATEAYLRAAGESDVYEITSSQLALQRTQNPSVRGFATMMIRHHTETTDALLAAAMADRVAPPPAVLGPQKRAMIDQLNAQGGRDFDRLYAQQQAAAHQEALAIHSAYAQSGDAPRTRKAATTAVPIVQQHLAEVQRLQAVAGM